MNKKKIIKKRGKTKKKLRQKMIKQKKDEKQDKDNNNIQIQPGLIAKLPSINLYFKLDNKLVIHKSVHLRAH